MHDRVLRVLVGRESVPTDTGTERFDEPAVGRDNERAVVPVGVRPVFAHEAEPLPEMDDATPELAAVREDEVARQRVGISLTWRDVLESHLHCSSRLTGHAVYTCGMRVETARYEGPDLHGLPHPA